MSVVCGKAQMLPVTARKQELLDKTKTFQCPSCCTKYEFHFRNDTLTGRVPLILPCKHTVCEGCIRTAVRQKQITCPKCATIQSLDKPEMRLQEMFPVNFYILGLVYYSKPVAGDHLYDFKPAGYRWLMNPQRAPLMEELIEIGFETVKHEICSKVECNKPAELECAECTEMYCAPCCDKVHKMVRGFRNHKISPLARKDIVKEISQTCTVHVGAILEYHCKDCSVDVCCHCFIQQHAGHPYFLVTDLTEENRTEFMELVGGAEEMLKRLEQTQKQVNDHMKQLVPSRSASVKTEAEIRLSEGFADLHARLQTVEEALRANVVAAVHSSYYKLAQMATELDSDLRALTSLLNLAKTIVNGGCAQKKINVQKVVEKLKNVADLPCVLVGKQMEEAEKGVRVKFSEILDNLDEHITVSHDTAIEYNLVPENGVPDGFEMLQPPEHSITSTGDISSGKENFASDSDGDIKDSTDIVKWLQETRTHRPRRHHHNFSSAPAVVNIENVEMYHINTPNSFYVQLSRSKQEYQELNNKLLVHVKNLPAFVHEPALNEIYAVKYEIKANRYQWCRGRVTEIIEREPAAENLYEIFYLDYGNVQKVKKANLRKLTPELMSVPPFAVHCGLYNIIPKEGVWDKRAMQMMLQIIDNDSLLMYVQDRLPGIWHVDLITISIGGDSTSVHDALLFTGYGTLQDFTVDIEVPMQAINSETVQLIKNDNVYKESDTFNVVVTYVKDPDRIYVQKASNYKSIKELEASIHKFYSNKKNKCRVFNPKKGMAVVVYYPEAGDCPWYRGEVVSVTKGEGLVEVYLVDYGRQVSVSWANLRKIQLQFITFECQAILLKLADVEPVKPDEGWDEAAIAYLNAYLQDKQHLKIVVSKFTDRAHVALFECLPDIEISVNAVLVTSGYAVSTGKISQTVKWHKQQRDKKPDGFTTSLLKTIQSTAANQPITEEQRYEDDDEHATLIKKPITVLKANTPDEIYIKLTDEKTCNRLSVFQKSLQAFYTTDDKCLAKELCKGCTYVVYQKTADHYARATLLELMEGDKVVMQLCDTAELIVVEDRSDIYDVDEQFYNHPNAAVKCHLDGIIPAGDSKKWSLLAVEYLQEIFKNQNAILMTKSNHSDPATNSWPVIMWYGELIDNGPLEPTQRKLHSINKELLTNGLALKKRPNKFDTPMEMPQELLEFLPARPITKKRFRALITYVDEYGAIYLQDNDVQAPFKMMEDKMRVYFESTETETDVFKPGDLCTYRYSTNANWYRGKVTATDANTKTYKVFAIDFGNVETCKHNDLRKTVMFVDIPSFASKYRLYNVFSKEKKWLTSDVHELQDLLNVQAVVVLVQKNGLIEVYLENGVCVNEYIVRRSSHLSRKPFTKALAHTESDDDVIIDDVVEEITVTTAPSLNNYKYTELPPVGTKVEVGLVNALKYNQVIFELNSNLDNENFHTLSQCLNEGGAEQPYLMVIKVGQPCLAKFSEDQHWYRAQITEIINSEMVNVWYVDFGNFEDVRINDLREIKTEWLKYPLQQFRAEIYGIKLRDEAKANEAVQFWNNLLGMVQTAKIVNVDPLRIELFKPDSDEELLYWDLIEGGILAL